MQASRCFRFFYQCTGRSPSLIRCLREETANSLQSCYRGTCSQFYSCVKDYTSSAHEPLSRGEERSSEHTDEPVGSAPGSPAAHSPVHLSPSLQSPSVTASSPARSYASLNVTENSSEHKHMLSEEPEENDLLYKQSKSEPFSRGDSDSANEVGVAYFRSLVSTLTKADSERLDVSSDKQLTLRTQDLTHLRPSLPAKSGNLATYVNDSETLTKLVQLGVDLSAVEKKSETAAQILRCDFSCDVQPRLELLLRLGVKEEDLGHCLSKRPDLLLQDLDDIQVRVNYLESKRFDEISIARIITKAPGVLCQATEKTDAQLGSIQKMFFLTGQEVRKVITSYPKLTTWPLKSLKEIRFTMKEFLGFSDAEQKSMLLFQPKIYTSNRRKLEDVFDLLHNTMGLSHEFICQWPQVFRTRSFILRQRHAFLTSIQRNQYDPTCPNFVSLKALVSGSDSQFCKQVAKVPVQEFNAFLKTL